MTNHRITFIGTLDNCQARCSCKQKSPIGDRGMAEGWRYAHLQEVERIRAHLGTRTPSLKQQRDWFVTQAENTDNDYEDRALWRQMAEEIDRHITAREPMRQTEVLF